MYVEVIKIKTIEYIRMHPSIHNFRNWCYYAWNENYQNILFHSSVFFNFLLFASCTDTFSKWCKIPRGMKRSAQ
jgi:hypothetical protein